MKKSHLSQKTVIVAKQIVAAGYDPNILVSTRE